jgi:hypothetical protein
MKIFKEEYCDHGMVRSHGFELTNCPGGSREEFTPSMEAAGRQLWQNAIDDEDEPGPSRDYARWKESWTSQATKVVDAALKGLEE